MIVSIIAAMEEGSRGIGLRGNLPWRLPADMARFRELTMGHTVIMGRATWEPIAERGLPGRRVIVLSRERRALEASFEESPPDAIQQNAESVQEPPIASSLREAFQIVAEDELETEVFIAGGAQVYQAALEQGIVERMYLTIVHADLEADTFFPIFDETDWVTVLKEEWHPDERNPYRMTFRHLERVPD